MPSYHKKGVKCLGVACSSFNRIKDSTTTIYGAIMRGGQLLEGVIKIPVTVDGDDVTTNLLNALSKSKHYEQITVIITKGVTTAGLNYFDLKTIQKETNFAVISIVDRDPSFDAIKKALEHVPNSEQRYQIITQLGHPKPVVIADKKEPIYIHHIGISFSETKKLLKTITKVGGIPEPIRVATLIATAE
jgi:hypothetical protein